MNLSEFQARLRRAEAALGHGRLAATFRQDGGSTCSILHWREVGGREECREIAHGSVDACLAALDAYVGAAARAERGRG